MHPWMYRWWKHVEFWNVDGERELSDAWTVLTRFISLNESHRTGTHGPERDLKENKKHLVLTWKFMSDAAKKKAKQRWAIEKPKLDNARQLTGMFFIEPNDEEFKLTISNALQKSDKEPWKNHRNIGKRNTKCACIDDADENTRRSSTQTLPRSYHWKRDEFPESLHSCSQIHSDTTSNENSGCQGSSGKKGKLDKIPAWQLMKVRNKNEAIDEARNFGQ